MIGIFILLEALVLIIVWVKYIVDVFSFSKQGIPFKQDKLQRLGTTLGFVGTIVVIVIPRLVGVRDDLSSTAQIAYLLITLIGVFLTVIGFRFVTMAYKPEDETLKWVRWILHFWK